MKNISERKRKKTNSFPNTDTKININEIFEQLT